MPLARKFAPSTRFSHGTSSGVCLTTKGSHCGGSTLVSHVHLMNAALLLAVKGHHHFVAQPDFCGGKADRLFRQNRREYVELKRSVPWYTATCTARRFVSPAQRCGAECKVTPTPPDP